MENFLRFYKNWQAMPMLQKIDIASKTDLLNNKGAILFNIGDVKGAITNFRAALEVMPINDDALNNLIICYKKVGDFSQIPAILSRLYIVEPTSILKKKIIAFSLLSLLIENCEDEQDYGMVSLSNILKRVNEDYDINIIDNEIMDVCDKINEQYSADILTWGHSSGFMFTSSYEKYYSSKPNVPRSLLRDELRDILTW